MGDYFIGIDIGTGSARAGVFAADGRMLSAARQDIALFLEAGDVAEQSSQDIWAAAVRATRTAVAGAGIDPAEIRGIGFDATCSLVLVDAAGAPVTVSGTGDPDRNIIVWMDHRATREARDINATQHAVLRYVGGRISPEMETPKLLWLKRHLPESYAKAAHFFDLADYMTWRATGSLARSICTVTCKWTYLGHQTRWDESYFRAIGLDDLADADFARIGATVVEPGMALAHGLTEAAAADFGLLPGTVVSAGLIDAHAGGLGTVGAAGGDDRGEAAITRRMGYVFGTSACTMASSTEPAFVPGVWGPYYSAMVPGLWLNEGGQSAAGAAIDQLLHCHPAATEAEARARAVGRSLVDIVAEEAQRLAAETDPVALMGALTVVPDFLGNRSPFAEPEARGVIAGLGMDRSLTSLAGLYLAGICGLGYGMRQILNAMAAQGIEIETVVVSGGASGSPFIRQLLADSAGVAIAGTEAAEPVLLGAAMLGAVAAGHYEDLPTAMPAMSRLDAIHHPAAGETAAWHARRFASFTALQLASRSLI
jgi:D-ribulokinase